MTIESAIKMLSEAKNSGVKSVVLSFWQADLFNKSDDKEWEELTEIIEDSMDWSLAHDQISTIIEDETE